jgi:hypothetical protein
VAGASVAKIRVHQPAAPKHGEGGCSSVVKKPFFAKRTHFGKFGNRCKSIRSTKTSSHFGAKTNPFSPGSGHSKPFKGIQSVSKLFKGFGKKISIPSRKDAEQIYVDLWNLRFKLKISGMKYKASIYTLISLMLVTSATIFIEFWCPWEIVIPSKLIFVGYGFLAVSAFLNPNLKGRNWIYGMAISLGVLRMMFMVFLKPWDSFGFIVQHVEPVVVVFVGLTSFAFALWRRFLKIQV